MLSVINLLGRQIRVLASGTQPPDSYEVRFDATGHSSRVCSYRLEAGSLTNTLQLVAVE